MNTQIKNWMNGAENIVNCSAQSFAMLFGEISPKINTTTVTTTVEIVAPESPYCRTKITVPSDAIAMFTMLFPMSTVEISLPYCSSSRQASAAFLFPFSASAFNFVVLTEENAVSVAEK